MMKNKIGINKGEILVLIAVLLVIVISGTIFVSAEDNTEIGSNYETTCDGDGLCETTLYSYEKYFLRGREWELIDESWSDCSVGQRQEFCSREYHYKAVLDEDGRASNRRNQREYAFGLSQFLNYSLDFSNINVDGSLITYENIAPNIDLRYQYLPKKLKEDLIIKAPLDFPRQDFEIVFTKTGVDDFLVAPSFMCDTNQTCVDMRTFVSEHEIRILVPVDFFAREDIQYPVFIDPTIELNDTALGWNGYIENYTNSTGSTFTRTHNPGFELFVGGAISAPSSTKYRRADLDWNLTIIPDNSEIYSANLYLWITGDSGNNNLTNADLEIRHMEGYVLSYPNTKGDCEGNCNFYKDIANGTIYATADDMNGRQFNVSLALSSDAVNDIEDKIAGNLFSTGLNAPSYTSGIGIGSRDNNLTYKRPKLTIVYGVNATDSDFAIIEGINTSVIGPNIPIQTGQKIYLVSNNGQHYIGTFDKTTIFGNQTWAFSYILPSESPLNIPSLFRVLNVWENQSLTYSEIVNQVKGFINITIY